MASYKWFFNCIQSKTYEHLKYYNVHCIQTYSFKIIRILNHSILRNGTIIILKQYEQKQDPKQMYINNRIHCQFNPILSNYVRISIVNCCRASFNIIDDKYIC